MSDCTLRNERSASTDPPGTGIGKGCIPDGAAEAHRRIVDHAPAGGVDLDRPPRLVAEIEIEPAVQPADADMDDAFRRIEMRLGLDHVQRRLQRLRTRRAVRLLEEAARQPAAEALGADRPGLAMAVDVEIGEAGAVGGVEQFGGCASSIRMSACVGPRPRVAAFLGDGLVERRHAAPGLLQLRAQRLEGGAIFLLQRREPLQHLGREGRARIGCGLLDQSFQRIGDVLGRVDGVRDQVLAFVRSGSSFIVRPPRAGREAAEHVDEAADVFDTPRRDARSELDRLRKRARLHLSPESRRREREDPRDELGFADVATLGQKAGGLKLLAMSRISSKRCVAT